MIIPLNTVIGSRDLCAWQPVTGIVWMQTRQPKIAQLLERRKDGRLVARGVAGGYLRTFEFGRPLSWAVDWMARYTAAETRANEALIHLACP